MQPTAASSRTSEARVTTDVRQTDMIDLITRNSESDEITLVIVEERAFGSDPEMLTQLQMKLNSYLRYALDGQMAEDYPEHMGKPITIQLECRNGPPDEDANSFLYQVAEQINAKGIRFLVDVG